jgi:hypothetical protein
VQPKPREKAEVVGTFAGPAASEVEPGAAGRPLLMVDIDGVISLFGVPSEDALDGVGPRGSLHSVDGMVHFLSATAAANLLELSELYELVWASGWEERAEEHLPRLLGVPSGLPYLRFGREAGNSGAHWKLEAIDGFAGERPLAWVDDCFNDACRRWAAGRASPTLLVATEPRQGLTARETALLRDWAIALDLSGRADVEQAAGTATAHAPAAGTAFASRAGSASETAAP